MSECSSDEVRTLTMGYTIRLDRDVSKKEMVAVCRELEDMFGPGNEFRPYAGKGLLEWKRRYGETGGGGKMMKLVMHKRWRVETIAWPKEVPDNVMELWRDDDSLCARQGWYRTQIVAFGRAARWNRSELRLMREVFIRAGWRVSGVGSVRGTGQKYAGKCARRPDDYRYFEQPLQSASSGWVLKPDGERRANLVKQRQQSKKHHGHPTADEEHARVRVLDQEPQA